MVEQQQYHKHLSLFVIQQSLSLVVYLFLNYVEITIYPGKFNLVYSIKLKS